MTNPLLGPYADEQAMMTPPGYTSRCVPLTEAWMKMALATGVITPPTGDHRQIRVWPWVAIGLVCVVAAFAYGALAR